MYDSDYHSNPFCPDVSLLVKYRDMNMDYSLFTNKSRNAIDNAVALSKQCGYAAVEPQVMVAAIHQVDRDRIPFLLIQMGVDKNAFFTTISDSLRSIHQSRTSEPGFSSELLDVLQKAMQLSKHEAHDYIALEYIFWAFIETQNAMNGIMRQYGITSQKMAEAVHQTQKYKLYPERLDMFYHPTFSTILDYNPEIGGGMF